MSAKSMLRVKYALDHHAAPLKPLFTALQFALDGSGLPHSFGSRLGGANSNFLNVSGRVYFLKGILRPELGIEIRERVHGPVIGKLKNERDVIRFVEKL
jgi:hypothetical protein